MAFLSASADFLIGILNKLTFVQRRKRLPTWLACRKLVYILLFGSLSEIRGDMSQCLMELQHQFHLLLMSNDLNSLQWSNLQFIGVWYLSWLGYFLFGQNIVSGVASKVETLAEFQLLLISTSLWIMLVFLLINFIYCAFDLLLKHMTESKVIDDGISGLSN